MPIFIFYLIWTYGIRRMAERQGFGGLMAIGKSRAKVYVETDTKVTFRDVAGVDEAKYSGSTKRMGEGCEITTLTRRCLFGVRALPAFPQGSSIRNSPRWKLIADGS